MKRTIELRRGQGPFWFPYAPPLMHVELPAEGGVVLTVDDDSGGLREDAHYTEERGRHHVATCDASCQDPRSTDRF